MSRDGPSNEQQSPPIFKLTINQIENICEWLPLADCLALRRTCKRFQQFVDCIIKGKYPGVKIGHGRIRLYICDIRTIENGEVAVLNYDNKFDRLIELDGNDIKLIKEVKMWGDTIGSVDLANVQRILPKIEKLQIGTYKMEGDFYDTILRYCENLRSMSIYRIEGRRIINHEKMWMQRNYPSMEHLMLDDNDIGGPGCGEEIVELGTFFAINPQVRHFSTTFHFLWENRKWILASDIRFEQLDVGGDCFEERGMDRICGLLNTLHEGGYYQRCHIYAIFVDTQDEIDHIMSIQGMEKVYISTMVENLEFGPMLGLKELGISYSPHYGNWNRIAHNLGNVEKMYFSRAVSSDIVSIIRFAGKVTEIKISQLDAGDYFENGVIDLYALNEMRKKLHGAQRLTIYVEEEIFLATKWVKIDTCFDLIELKRSECVEQTHQFY